MSADMRGEVVASLQASVERLGADEVRVLACIARRLELGATQYGPLRLAADNRDWKREASEEMLDASVYLALATLRGDR